MRIRAKALEKNLRLVEWEAVQKWDGKLPQYQLGGATPFINLRAGQVAPAMAGQHAPPHGAAAAGSCAGWPRRISRKASNRTT